MEQINKCTASARLQTALMRKKPAWNILAKQTTKYRKKNLYVGRVGPVLDYGVAAAWGTGSKSNFDKINKVQNKSSRIITGALRATPIQSMETVTGLENLESRRNTKTLCKLQNSRGLKPILGCKTTVRRVKCVSGRLVSAFTAG